MRYLLGLSFIKPSFFIVFLCCYTATFSLNSEANAFRKVVLKYRDAEEVRAIIAPLLPEGSAISVDNNSVLLSTPASMINSVVSAIQSIDKPQTMLQVSVFRGKYPNKKGVITHTTNTQINQLQTIATEEGQIVVVTERGLAKIKVSDTLYMNNTDAVASPSADKSTAQIMIDDNALTALTTNTAVTEAAELGVIALDNTGELLTGEIARGQKSELVDVPSGIHLRVTLAGKNKAGQQQARAAIKVVTPTVQSANALAVESIALSSSVETLTTFPVNEWVLISENNTLSHRPALGANRVVHSTDTADDKQQSVWLKVEVK